ncbi:MAG: hypothetical protein DWQ47_13665 [Acidobacteria bacterium]|nr:MAG: hypothetical protein DWQ32_01065 [Acidobacteriota bacterium]REK02879.1 MAG: hypothetical protein DWQ38_11070 [Acidobacteriota bacterium]REK13317.1 MAG: hypothetical protein DWQ43_06755 [Acidobacteriota bacterium]REK41311.1 MAG: hypothetical protein DWQ47_13665 [Acidobacteriota bacterium]
MLDKLNLSSDPFRNRTLPYLIAAAVLLFAFIGAIFGVTQYRADSVTNELVESDIDAMAKDLRALDEKEKEVRQSLTPAQEQLMVASHTLVAHKDFSWSRLLSDLETVLPGSVSASRINVENVYRENGQLRAELDFAVLAREYQGVLEMIRRMNESGIFRASLRGQDRQKSERFTYSEFTLKLTYFPRAGYAPAPPADVAVNTNEGGGR